MNQAHYLALTLCLFTSFLFGQQSINNISTYFPFQSVDSLVYQSNHVDAPQMIMAFSGKRTPIAHYYGSSILEDFKLCWVADKGLVVVNQENEKQGVLLIPNQLHTNEVYRTSVNTRIGQKQHEVRILGYDMANTPMRNYKKCLVVLIKTRMVDAQGIQSEQLIKQWYAPTFGLVKMSVKNQEIGKKANYLTYELAEAKINGAWQTAFQKEFDEVLVIAD